MALSEYSPVTAERLLDPGIRVPVRCDDLNRWWSIWRSAHRKFRAFDAETGELLWSQVTNSGVIGVPSSYAIDGVQYVAVLSGYGVDAAWEQELLNLQIEKPKSVPQGGVLWVFRLGDAP